MKILKVKNETNEKIINETVKVFKNGGLVIYPTETCYGVGVDAENQNAVNNVLRYKRRPEGKPISIAVDSTSTAKKYVKINAEAQKIHKNFLPGPFTVISESRGNIAKGLASELNTLGIRIPDFNLMLKILKKLGKGVTATSANSAGKKTPYNIKDIFDNISEKQKSLIDLVIDAGDLPHNPPSSVIDTTKGKLQIIREGAQLPFKSKKKHLINSPEKMRELARELCKEKMLTLENNCLVIYLSGEMGAGKTTFVKGMAEVLKIKDTITSPTYTLVEEYDHKYKSNDAKFVHIDFWRIEDFSEVELLKLDSYVKPGNVIAIEWGDKIMKKIFNVNLKKKLKEVEVKIKYINQDKREVLIYDIE
jgi:L-threonylcarbamoyladenylate synthase